MKRVSMFAYSDLKCICEEVLTEKENEILTKELLKGSKSINAKFKIMLEKLLEKANRRGRG